MTGEYPLTLQVESFNYDEELNFNITLSEFNNT